eukprot:COSAG01_NODE_47285_length_392_cov_0.337884_1_plen_85_part_10
MGEGEKENVEAGVGAKVARGSCWGGVVVGEDDSLPLSAFPALCGRPPLQAAAAGGVAGRQPATPAPGEATRRWVIRRVRPLAVFE